MSDNDVFNMIFDSRTRKAKHQKGQQGSQKKGDANVIVPPSMRKKPDRSKSRKSKYYTRPIFKEPGSKIGQSYDDEEEDPEESVRMSTSRNRMGIIHGLRDEVGKILAAESNADAIQPVDKTQDRLKQIIHTPAARSSPLLSQRDFHASSRPRHPPLRSKPMRQNDSLETRRLLLGYSIEKQRSDMSDIRREVKGLVDDIMLSQKEEPEARFGTIKSPHHGESRDEQIETLATSSRGNGSNGQRTGELEGTATPQGVSEWSDAAVCSLLPTCGCF